MWLRWDERLALAPDPAAEPLAGRPGAGVRSAAASCAPPLLAAVDLECPYLRDLVLAAFARRSPTWAVVRADGEGDVPHPLTAAARLVWGEYERIDWERAHAGALTASSYCVRKGLIRKAQLAHNLKKWVAKRGGGGGRGGGSGPATATAPARACPSTLAAAVPETYVLQIDDEDYVDEALCDLPEVRDMVPGSMRWIVKPSVTNRAAGVAVIDSCAGLRAALAAAPDLREWVVQRYVDPPHLLGGRKWHVRAYALCVGALAAYVFTGGLVLRARAPYAGAALGALDAHLTNTCRGARADVIGGSGGEGRCSEGEGGRAMACQPEATAGPPPPDAADAGLDDGDVVLTLDELPAALVADGLAPAEAEARVAALRARVNAVVGETFEAVAAELTFFALPSCFELFGFDLMLDSAWNVWLLEANAEPDVAQSGERLRPLVASMVDGAAGLAAGLAEAGAAGAGPGPPPERVACEGGYAWQLVYARDSGRGRSGGGIKVA